MKIVFPLSPDTGVAWTVAELNALEVAIISAPDALADANGLRFTQVYVDVDAVRTNIGRYSDVAINSRADIDLGDVLCGDVGRVRQARRGVL